VSWLQSQSSGLDFSIQTKCNMLVLASDSEIYMSQVPEFVKELVSDDLPGLMR
jgi:hypothetical protein